MKKNEYLVFDSQRFLYKVYISLVCCARDAASGASGEQPFAKCILAGSVQRDISCTPDRYLLVLASFLIGLLTEIGEKRPRRAALLQ